MLDFGKRLIEFRNKLQMPQNEVSTNLGLKQGSYSDIERDKSKGSTEILKKLAEIYNLNLNWLLTGKGTMLVNDDVDEIVAMGDVMGKPNITVVPFAVNAGAGIESQLIETVTKAYLPFIRQGAYAFQIKGNSMKPIFEDGDWVISYLLEDVKNIKVGTPYILKLYNGEYLLKYVDIRGLQLILRSENWREYSPQEFNIQEIISIYEIEKRLTTFWGWT